MGELTPEIMIAMAGVVIVAVALHYHIKGAFCIGLVFGTIVWWFYEKIVPDLLEDPAAGEDYLTNESYTPGMWLLIFDLLFLMILTLNGLARAMSGMASFTLISDSSIHRLGSIDTRERGNSPWTLAVHRDRCGLHRQWLSIRPAHSYQPGVGRGYQSWR